MRIAIISERVEPRRGGAETYVADLLRALDQRGHHTLLFAAAWDPRALPMRTTTIPVPHRGAIRLFQIWNFARDVENALSLHRDHYDVSLGLINTWSHDVIIPQGGLRAASLEANSRRFAPGIPRTLYQALKIASPRHALYHAIEARQYHPDRQAIVVAPSQMVKQHILNQYPVPPERIHVIHNAIDAARLDIPAPGVARAQVRARFQLADHDCLALFVGHNFRLKGLPPLLEALALRRRDNPAATPFHLLVCGSGKQAPMLRLAQRLGIENYVHMAGYVDDIRIMYHAADAFVLPSYYDPCSLVLFEALACGLPVITTRRNGAGEVLTQGREGFVIPHPGDIPALARALDQLAHPEARCAMAAAARTLGQRQTFDHHVEQLTAVLARAAESRADNHPHAHPPHTPRAASRTLSTSPLSLSPHHPQSEEA